MTYVYVIRDHEDEIRSVTSSLKTALEVYITIASEGTSAATEDHSACILVWEIDGGCVWSYDTIEEITDALFNGENYDD